MKRCYIIGLAPSQEPPDGNSHCLGNFKRRICEITGMSYHAYDTKFVRLNLFTHPWTTPPTPNEAKARAREIVKLVNQTCVELGEHAILITCGIIAGAAIEEVLEDSSTRIHLQQFRVPLPSARSYEDPGSRNRLTKVFLNALIDAADVPKTFHAKFNVSTLTDASQPIGA